LFNFFY